MNVRDVIGGLQPTQYAVIGIGLLVFNEFKQFKKWKAEPPEPLKIKPLRMLLAIVLFLAFSGVLSIALSPDASYAVLNFAIICVLQAIAATVFMLGRKKYAKPRAK
jgi:heme A synthase